MTVFRINDWHKNFENNRSRDIKNPAWVAMPNRHDGLGFRTLIGRPNGMALYGVWCVLVQVASKSSPRGFLIRDNGHPHTPGSLSMKTGVPESLISECLEILQDPEIDWISPQEHASHAQHPATKSQPILPSPHHGAAAPHDDAETPQPHATSPQVAHARNERTNGLDRTGQNRTERTNDDHGQFPKTAAAVCARFPTADTPLVMRIVETSVRMFLSVDRPKISAPTDDTIAEAVAVAFADSKKRQNSPALFLTTVPTVVANWARHGKNGVTEAPVVPADTEIRDALEWLAINDLDPSGREDARLKLAAMR